MHSFNNITFNNINAHTEKKVMLNGRIIMDKAVDLDYDGKLMKLNERENGKTILKTRLTNNDIMKLMSKPSAKMSLLERLQKDYNISGTRKVVRKGKLNKKNKKGGKKTRRTKMHKI
jgi:hypothetical protein